MSLLGKIATDIAASQAEKKIKGTKKKHSGWQEGGHKTDPQGRNWNARGMEEKAPAARTDRPQDTRALMAGGQQRGAIRQGTTAMAKRAPIDNWYHQSSNNLTSSTSVRDWQEVVTRRT